MKIYSSSNQSLDQTSTFSSWELMTINDLAARAKMIDQADLLFIHTG